MKKVIGLFCGCLIFSNVCFAYTSCKGGTVIYNSDKTSSFCKSNNVMSWYAAHAWCYANGGRLATNQNLCNRASPGGTCDKMVNSVDYNAWGFVNYRSSTNCGRVHLKDGRNGNTSKLNRAVRSASGESSNYGGITDMYALCE